MSANPPGSESRGAGAGALSDRNALAGSGGLTGAVRSIEPTRLSSLCAPQGSASSCRLLWPASVQPLLLRCSLIANSHLFLEVRGIGSIGLGVSHRSGELPPSVWATIAKGILAGAIMALAFGLLCLCRHHLAPSFRNNSICDHFATLNQKSISNTIFLTLF
jgi:hypothetical protein